MIRRITISLLIVALVGLAACDSQKADEPAQADQAEQVGQTEEAEQAVEEEEPDQEEPAEAEIPADQTLEGETENGEFYVVMTPEPNPIPFQELFVLDVKVYEDESKATLAEGVGMDQLRAVMPAHGHGMKNAPQIEKTDEGSFTVEGMRFHMQGEGKHGLWVVEAVLNREGTIDQTKFDVQCCRD